MRRKKSGLAFLLGICLCLCVTSTAWAEELPDQTRNENSEVFSSTFEEDLEPAQTPELPEEETETEPETPSEDGAKDPEEDMEAQIVEADVSEEPEPYQIFPDVPDSAWYAEPVNALTQWGMINGKPDGNFDPEGSITRSEFLKLLAELCGKPLSANRDFLPSFSDVKSSDWFYSYAYWGLKEKLINGVGGGRFAPDTPVTREQIAVFLWRFSRNVLGKLLPKDLQVSFLDSWAIHSWASVEVKGVTSAGLMHGYENGCFYPGKKATRAEAAKILYDYYNAFEEYSRGCSLDEMRTIMHAGGTVELIYYTNSLEALEESYWNGNYLIELDFSWTTDGTLAGIHNWGNGRPQAMTAEEFLKLKIEDRYTPITLDTLAPWLEEHPEVRIIPDVKEKNVEAMRLISTRYPHLKNQFIPYVFTRSECDPIKQMGFQNLIFMIYSMPQSDWRDAEGNMKFIREKEITGIAIAPYQMREKYGRLGREMGIPVLTFTVDRISDMNTYAKVGVDGFFTDLQNLKLDR